MIDATTGFQINVYAPVRQFVGRVTITLFGETNIYDNETIIRMNILEEMSTLNESLPSGELQLTMDNSNGDFDLLNFQNMHQIIASKPKIVCELGIVYESLADPEILVTDWIPSGVYFLSEWKNDITNKIVTLTGNDLFAMFSDISYEPSVLTNLKELASDVLTIGGVPLPNQQIDDSLEFITVNAVTERTDVRTLLQNIGIAGTSAVGQDRLGNVFIKPFRTLDLSSNYITYTASQRGIYSFAGSTMYALNNTGGGMRYLDFDNMYDPPEISLEKSVYQLVIKIYEGGYDSEPSELLYTNPAIEGNNGLSFTIDNPLINTEAIADLVAEWYIREINYNAIYKVKWRQNPALECADVILVEDSFSAEKQTRIVRQEINYQGYLEGITESRGGI